MTTLTTHRGIIRRMSAVLLACLFATLAPVVTTTSASAAEPVFPKGARVGLVPIEGLTLSSTFPGFEATDRRVKVVVSELPREAFAAVEAAAESDQKPDPAAPNRPKIERFELESGTKAFISRETAVDEGSNVRRFSVLISGHGFAGYVAIQVPDLAGDVYSDEAVRKMLASATLRIDVPPEEQLDRLPFRLTDLGNFKTLRTLPNTATVLLTDTTSEDALDAAPYMLIGLIGNGPATPDDRGRFAEQLARSLPGLRDAHITTSEPMRIDGAVGFETRIDAISSKDSVPVTVVQWLRFGSTTTTLRIVAVARRDEWLPAFTRFRAVRDGINPR